MAQKITSVKEKDFIPSLTGIRAIAAYFVFFFHLNSFSTTNHPTLYLMIRHFYPVLSLFFVMSGFIICHKYYEISSLKKDYLHKYLINRVSRILPILFIIISIQFVLIFYQHLDTIQPIIKKYILSITLLKGFSSEYRFSGIGPSWSMSVEELFYFLSPLLFLYVRNIFSLIKVVLAFYAAGIILTFIFSHFNNDGFFSDYKFTFFFTFFGRIFDFACGIFLALIVKGKFSNSILKKTGAKSLYIGIGIILLSTTGQFYLAKINHTNMAIELWPGLFLNNIIMPIGVVFMFYGLIYYQSPLKKFLSTKLMVALGSSTYSFYLLHTSFLLSWIYKFISTNLLIIFICMVFFSYLFYRTIEQPMTIFLRKKFYKKDKQQTITI